MEIFRQWAYSLLISGMAGTIVSLLAPRGNMEKVLRTVVGIFIVSVLCSPLTKLKTDAAFPSLSFDLIEAVQADSLGKQMEETCRQTIGIVAKETAEEFGITEYELNTELYIDSEFCINIQEIHIVIPSEYQAVLIEFSEKLQIKLGVPITAECK